MPKCVVSMSDKAYRELYIKCDKFNDSMEYFEQAFDPDDIGGENDDGGESSGLTPAQLQALNKLGSGKFKIIVSDDGSLAIK